MYHLAEVLLTLRHELLSIHPSIHPSRYKLSCFEWIRHYLYTVEEHLHRAIHRPLLHGTVVLHLLHIDIHSCNAISKSQLELDVCYVIILYISSNLRGTISFQSSVVHLLRLVDVGCFQPFRFIIFIYTDELEGWHED